MTAPRSPGGLNAVFRPSLAALAPVVLALGDAAVRADVAPLAEHPQVVGVVRIAAKGDGVDVVDFERIVWAVGCPARRTWVACALPGHFARYLPAGGLARVGFGWGCCHLRARVPRQWQNDPLPPVRQRRADAASELSLAGVIGHQAAEASVNGLITRRPS